MSFLYKYIFFGFNNKFYLKKKNIKIFYFCVLVAFSMAGNNKPVYKEKWLESFFFNFCIILKLKP